MEEMEWETDNSKVTEEEELAAAEYELSEVEAQLLNLSDRKQILLQRIEKIKDTILLKKNHLLTSRNWASTDFPWSNKVKEILKSVFKLSGFRPLQQETINAVLSNEDVILIMPTGGGKSLCYQLPALVKSGITLVISPLVSLMEDQLMGLRGLNVPAAMFSATSTKEEVNSIQDAMLNKNGKLKLLYVTPEKLAKSKRFMTKLQKMYGLGRLSLIAIDEVHCCSQWGHDFRPDYKFLGVLKGMFPDGCLVLKASFNRPNLYYEVRVKASNQEECLQELADLLKTRYQGQSGIIYTTSIKDCEQLMYDLRKKNLRVGCYHANLEAELRSKVHSKWMSGEYQAVVATIAFGLGIDKPDVRFVIHHSLSKSMENFYQESGRAGRDNKRAECILLYRLADVFKLSSMVFTQQTGLQNLYSMVDYCLDTNRCRRDIIASHFDEAWDNKDCSAMCDHCRKPKERKEVDITSYCRAMYRLISNAAGSDTKLTAQKLLDAWYSKGASNLRVQSIPVPKFSRETGESIVGYLLIKGYLQEDFHFTPYSTISYLKRGPKASAAMSDNHKIIMYFSGKSLSPSSVQNNKTTEKPSSGHSNKESTPSLKVDGTSSTHKNKSSTPSSKSEMTTHSDKNSTSKVEVTKNSNTEKVKKVSDSGKLISKGENAKGSIDKKTDRSSNSKGAVHKHSSSNCVPSRDSDKRKDSKMCVGEEKKPAVVDLSSGSDDDFQVSGDARNSASQKRKAIVLDSDSD
ncbi:hypothetical protein ANN_21617 [Periplaneta americana]|uniref:ATP-dependent DNA helicase n=1 Tax=Periplaneta americana TaxID=6978 RepID=A0ABQ8S5X6_PERAM|nr:hypothetical protein ANN_21617 [Periplaneta americana]